MFGTVFSFSSFSNGDDSFFSFCFALVGGDKCPTAIENSCDLFDSTLAVPPRSGAKLKPGNSGRVGFGSRTF